MSTVLDQIGVVRKSFALLLLVVLSSHNALGQTLRLNNTNEAPLTTPTHDGFIDIIAGEAFHRAGVTLQLIKLPAERGLLNANAGIEDGDLTRIAGLEKIYPNLIRVPEKLIDWEFVAYAKSPQISADWQDIRQHVVGHITGWKIYEHKLKNALHVVTAAEPEQLFQLLARNRIEVALYARWMGQAYVRQLGLKGIHQIEPTLASREMFIYLNKQHAKLVPKIARALRAIKQEGLYAQIQHEKLMPFTKKVINE